MPTEMVLIWGIGIPLFVTLRLLECLGHLSESLSERRRLSRRLARNQIRLSRDRPQVGRRPPILPPSRNGSKAPKWLRSAVEER